MNILRFTAFIIAFLTTYKVYAADFAIEEVAVEEEQVGETTADNESSELSEDSTLSTENDASILDAVAEEVEKKEKKKKRNGKWFESYSRSEVVSKTGISGYYYGAFGLHLLYGSSETYFLNDVSYDYTDSQFANKLSYSVELGYAIPREGLRLNIGMMDYYSMHDSVDGQDSGVNNINDAYKYSLAFLFTAEKDFYNFSIWGSRIISIYSGASIGLHYYSLPLAQQSYTPQYALGVNIGFHTPIVKNLLDIDVGYRYMISPGALVFEGVLSSYAKMNGVSHGPYIKLRYHLYNTM